MIDRMSDEKTNNDSSAPTLRGSSPSLHEKETSPAPVTTHRVVSATSSDAAPAKEGEDLKKVKSAKEVQEELDRVLTSGEGIEYPTGLRLGLIVLALCLSVFLMALVGRIHTVICVHFQSLGITLTYH